MKKLHAALVLAAAAIASPALAKGPNTLAVREGLTAEQLEVEGRICVKEAENAERKRPHGTTPGGIAADGRRPNRDRLDRRREIPDGAQCLPGRLRLPAGPS